MIWTDGSLWTGLLQILWCRLCIQKTRQSKLASNSDVHTVVAVETKCSVLDRLVLVRCGRLVDVLLDPAKFTSVNIKHCVSIVIWRGIGPHAVFILFLFLPTVWRQGNRTFPLCWCWMEFLFSMTEYELCGDSPEFYKKKNEQNLSFGPTVHFCDFVWNCLSCLLGWAEGKTATVTLRQCKTIPNSKLQTSCYKDRFMGVPLMNFMPFGGSPERLVIDHHRSDLNVSLRLLEKFLFSFLNARAWSYIITPSSHSPNSFGLKPNSRLLMMRLFSGWHFVSQLIYLPQMFCF